MWHGETMSLPDTIGGHSREALIWALKTKIALQSGWIPFTMGGRISPHESQNDALKAVCDPAKLAELGRAELIRRGVSADKEHHADAVIAHNGSLREPGIDVSIMGDAEREYTLPEFRAALLRVLELPGGATLADVTKALEVP